MKKTPIYIAMLIIGMAGAFSINTFSQKAAEGAKACTGEKFVMPASIAASNEAFDNYQRIAALPRKERGIEFLGLSNEAKANHIKVGLAMVLVKRPGLSPDQKAFILDMISKASAETYAPSSPERAAESEREGLEMVNKAFGLFGMKDAGEMIEPINADNTESLALIGKYQELLKNGMIARKRAAKEMAVQDRVNIWKTQLAFHLATGKFSKPQQNYIADFLMSISPDTFAPRTNMTKVEELKALEALEGSIFALFSKAEGYSIFMAIGVQKQIPDAEGLAPQWCECRWYCSYGTCGATGCVMFPECGPTGTWDCTNICNR